MLVGARALLIQGPSGSGKSRLAFTLLQAAEVGQLSFARLIADDRVLYASAYTPETGFGEPVVLDLRSSMIIGLRDSPRAS